MPRTMANFWYSDLYLIRPKEGLVKRASIYSAKGAAILRTSKVFPRLSVAIEDVELKVGTSAKLARRGPVREFVSPQEISSVCSQFNKTALVFGRGSSG